MFEPTSRYASLPTVTYTDATGRTFSYVRRRFLPDGKRQPLLLEVTVNGGDRLDLIAAQTLGDPLQFWRICDANNVMDPFDLTDVAGQILRINVPQAGS